MAAGNVDSPVSPVPETQGEVETKNKSTVEALYKALVKGYIEIVAKLLASDLEWWFHGPPKCHHMMRVLTGETTHDNVFRIEPRCITAIGDCVIAEGWER
ncbi:wound-induced protein 1-like [Quillaja saponaria]|uniref:Wound-induced protein 1-like n=1 Tax=Quillaja saponaria TaxID=32244 RepID=A0AAD7L3A5_QUISA|nr:wound-induced protein 1-like [Quillaja saponaria]